MCDTGLKQTPGVKGQKPLQAEQLDSVCAGRLIGDGCEKSSNTHQLAPLDGRQWLYRLHLFPHLTLLCSGLVVSTAQVYNSIHPVAKINLL